MGTTSVQNAHFVIKADDYQVDPAHKRMRRHSILQTRPNSLRDTVHNNSALYHRF